MCLVCPNGRGMQTGSSIKLFRELRVEQYDQSERIKFLTDVIKQKKNLFTCTIQRDASLVWTLGSVAAE